MLFLIFCIIYFKIYFYFFFFFWGGNFHVGFEKQTTDLCFVILEKKNCDFGKIFGNIFKGKYIIIYSFHGKKNSNTKTKILSD